MAQRPFLERNPIFPAFIHTDQRSLRVIRFPATPSQGFPDDIQVMAIGFRHAGIMRGLLRGDKKVLHAAAADRLAGFQIGEPIFLDVPADATASDHPIAPRVGSGLLDYGQIAIIAFHRRQADIRLFSFTRVHTGIVQ